MLQEINGRHLTGDKAGQPLTSYTEMKADGSTSGGCWIYTGVYADGVNQAARRKPGREQSSAALDWGWAWPANRRILYNRASADPDGKPWSERKALRLVGRGAAEVDRARRARTSRPTKPPSYRPDPGHGRPGGLAGDDPFIMQADGKGWLFTPKGMLDGPLPTHYEPQESPVRNPLYAQQSNPARKVFPRKDNLWSPSAGEPGAEVYPYVFTTYRLTEHHTAGGMSRWLPYLVGAAAGVLLRGLARAGGRARPRERRLGDDRLGPHRHRGAGPGDRADDARWSIGGRTIHQIGLPYHWGVGSDAVVSGDAANDLLGVALDPNVHIQETKAGSCDIVARPAAARARRCCGSWRSTSPAPASPS